MRHIPRSSPLFLAGLVFLAGLAAVSIGTALPAEAKPKTIQGTIRKFECGDNCYLTVLDKAKKEHTGLCVAPECQSWNENAEMPKRFIGKRVKVTTGTGQQLDGNGDVQGDFPSFTAIKFLN